jgi:hypothetical protein
MYASLTLQGDELMLRLRYVLFAGLVACMLSGCGESQPNAPAKPEQINPEFSQKSADMMKAANVGLNQQKAKPATPPAK